MEARTKTRNGYASNGSSDFAIVGPGPFPYQYLAWTLHDSIKKKKDELTGLTPPSDLNLLKVSFAPPLLSYHLSSMVDGMYFGSMSGMPCYAGTLLPDSPIPGWTALEGTTAELTASLLAKTNPFRPEVSVPVMVAELVEAASLLKLATSNAITLVGSAHLNYNFGWKQTVQDIRKLAMLTSLIESRIAEFNAIISKGGLRRSGIYLSSAGYQNPIETGPIFSNGLGSWNGQVSASFRTKVWGSVRWVPNRASPVDLSKLTSFNQACKTVLDLRLPDPATIWEAIPFSWLADYFVNVGDTLSAIQDTDKVLPTDVCIMRHREVTLEIKGIVKPEEDYPYRRQNSISSGKTVYDWKLRNVVVPDSLGDLLSFRIMSKGQATNLIALLASLSRFR